MQKYKNPLNNIPLIANFEYLKLLNAEFEKRNLESKRSYIAWNIRILGIPGNLRTPYRVQPVPHI